MPYTPAMARFELREEKAPMSFLVNKQVQIKPTSPDSSFAPSTFNASCRPLHGFLNDCGELMRALPGDLALLTTKLLGMDA